MKAHHTDFTKGSIYRNILELAIPMTMAQLINLLYNMVDRMYIGRMPDSGALALTGLGLCFPIITIISAFTNLFSVGGAPLCSMEMGKGNQMKAEKIMGNTFFMLLLSGIILTILGLIFYKPILYMFGASDATFPFSKEYIVIYLFGNIFVMIGLGMNSFINSQGFGQTGMMTVLLGAITNIILDPIFIFYLNMGVRGAALATIISQFLSAMWVIKFLSGNRAILKLRIKSLIPDWKLIKKITTLGLAGFIMAVTSSAAVIFSNTNLQFYGGDLYVGVMTIINSIREILTLPVIGLTNASVPVMSFNYGANTKHRVKKAIKFISLTCIIFTTTSWLILIMFPEFFIRIFNDDPKLISASIPSIKLYFMGFFMMSLQIAGQNVFVALGKSKQAIFFSIFRKVIIVIPLTIILPRLFNLGVNGVFMAEPISNFIGGAACFITMVCLVFPELSRS